MMIGQNLTYSFSLLEKTWSCKKKKKEEEEENLSPYFVFYDFDNIQYRVEKANNSIKCITAINYNNEWKHILP